jgi:HAMP domain-containing protein
MTPVRTRDYSDADAGTASRKLLRIVRHLIVLRRLADKFEAVEVHHEPNNANAFRFIVSGRADGDGAIEKLITFMGQSENLQEVRRLQESGLDVNEFHIAIVVSPKFWTDLFGQQQAGI